MRIGIKKKDGEQGMMVVEAVLSFTIFILVVMVILYLITIFMLHNRIQFALNSAAHELAAYSYVYEAFGIRNAGGTIEEDGLSYVNAIDDTTGQLVDTWNKIGALEGSASGVQASIQTLSPAEIHGTMKELTQNTTALANSAKQSAQKVSNLVSNPNDLLVGIIYMAGDAATTAVKNAFAAAAAGGITEKYLAVGEGSADAYLRNMGVINGIDGLDFSASTMFCDKERRWIDLVVEYDVDLGFAKILIPEGRLHLIQRVSVAGWLGGDDVKLSDYGVKKQ